MKIGDPYVREILDKAISTSQELKDLKFEINTKISQINVSIDFEEIKRSEFNERLEHLERQLDRLETAINQCQDTIEDAFKILDKIKDNLNMSEEIK